MSNTNDNKEESYGCLILILFIIVICFITSCSSKVYKKAYIERKEGKYKNYIIIHDRTVYNYTIQPRDYQIEVLKDTIYLYNKMKYIGKYYYKNTQLDTIITRDNQ